MGEQVYFTQKGVQIALDLRQVGSWAAGHREIVWAVVASLVTAFLFLGLCYLMNRRYRRRKDREISMMVRQFIDERNKSEAILADLDVGVIAYSSDGVRINSNPAAHKMLAPENEPETITDLLSRYGQENGLQAASLLGNASISGVVQHEDRILRIRLKESRFDEGRRAGTIVVLQDITDQEREEKQRKEFVANVSHELKTPLTTIKTYSESLLEWGLSEKNEDAVRKDIWRVHDDALRMERLVEDLLLLSSIDSRGIRVRLELLELPQVIRQVVDRLQHQAQDKSIDLDCFTLSRIPLVFVDRTAMERVLTNLVGNAIKYTEKGGSVKVYISYLLDDVYVKVSDTGFGIEKEHIPHIFNRFYRVDMTGSRMFGGTGLGLSIARELVELHGGRISVNSTLGKGTEFTVMIPIARKVMQDTINACQLSAPPIDPLHQTAAGELLEIARDLKIDEPNLAHLTRQQIDHILDRLLDRDKVEGNPDLADTKAFQTLKEYSEVDDPAAHSAEQPIR
ncbi:MAG: cell wall metabolism sensor histidine kinase WalK [Ruminococcaceae bacterium]|nr:cell wall metabolism sensor histidine kinase WalK [Oscillospiraceae bacterium]